MNPLRQAVADYLTIRRAMGYKLKTTEQLLDQFIDHLDDVGATTVTVDDAVVWATLPVGASARWLAQRLSVVRTFARWLATIDPATEIPPAGLLPVRRRRPAPYLYSDADLAALIAAADTLIPQRRATTYRTLFSLVAVTGMRIGEALALDRDDIDLDAGLLVIRGAKFGKSRQLPLHASTVAALGGYLGQHARLYPRRRTPAVFIARAGTRLVYNNVNWTFHELVARAGLQPRPPSSGPRIHDLRHSFAVNTLLDAYRAGADVQARLPLLSTYLGHVDPANTYWYLSAAPELLALAGDRLETLEARS